MAYEFDYLEQAQSATRRINSRMEKLTEELGAKNPLVEEYTAKLDMFFGDNVRFKDGVIQLSKPAEIFADPEKKRALEMMDEDVKSWDAVRQEWEKPYQEAQEKEASEGFGASIDFKEFINVQMNLPEMLSHYYTSGDIPAPALRILKEKGRKKTYSELNKVVQHLQKEQARQEALLRGGALTYHGVSAH